MCNEFNYCKQASPESDGEKKGRERDGKREKDTDKDKENDKSRGKSRSDSKQKSPKRKAPKEEVSFQQKQMFYITFKSEGFAYVTKFWRFCRNQGGWDTSGSELSEGELEKRRRTLLEQLDAP